MKTKKSRTKIQSRTLFTYAAAPGTGTGKTTDPTTSTITTSTITGGIFTMGRS